MILEDELEYLSDDEVNIEIPKTSLPNSKTGDKSHHWKKLHDNTKQELDMSDNNDRYNKIHDKHNGIENKANDNDYIPRHSEKANYKATNTQKKTPMTVDLDANTTQPPDGIKLKTTIDEDATKDLDNELHAHKGKGNNNVTNKVSQPHGICSQVSSPTESVSNVEFESESLSSCPLSISDENLCEDDVKQDLSPEDMQSGEGSVTDEVFVETVEPKLGTDANIGQSTEEITENDMMAANAEVPNMAHVSIKAMKSATLEAIPDDESIALNTTHRANGLSMPDHNSDKYDIMLDPVNTRNNVDNCSKHIKENGGLKHYSYATPRLSLNGIDFTEAHSNKLSSNEDIRRVYNEGGVSASNVIIDTEFQSPEPNHDVKSDKISGKATEDRNKDDVKSQEQSSRCSTRYVGNYRKIKLEGRRRQRLSIDSIPDFKQETREHDYPEINKHEENNGMRNFEMKGADEKESDKVNKKVVDKVDATDIMNTTDKVEISTGKRGESRKSHISNIGNANSLFANGRKIYQFRPRSAPVLRKRMDTSKHLENCKIEHTETLSMYSVDKTGKISPIPDNGSYTETNVDIGENSTSKNNASKVININSFHSEIMDLNNESLKKLQHIANNKDNVRPGGKQQTSTYRSKNVYEAITKHKNKYSRDQISRDGIIACRKDENISEMSGNEESVSNSNQNAINTRKQALHDDTTSRQCVDGSDSAVIVSCTDTHNKFDTKSFLLPVVNETGNCELEASATDVIEIDSHPHYDKTKHLSLRTNVKKNNELVQAKQSIVHSQKILRQREVQENLYGNTQLGTYSERAPVQRSCAKSRMSLKNEIAKTREHLNDVGKYRSEVNLKSKIMNDNHVEKQSTRINDSVNEHKVKTMNRSLARTINLDRQERNMSAGLRRPTLSIERTEGTSSSHSIRETTPLTDTARLRSIRKWLKLPDDNFDVTADSKEDESTLIIQQIIDGVLKTVCQHHNALYQAAMNTHRCSIADEEGDEVLGCLLQASVDVVDPSTFTCDVIDPLDVPPVTRKHEHLISNIIKISSNHGNISSELVVNIPISHWYVEPWQEVIVREQGGSGRWKETGGCVDIVKIDDKEKVVYGVRHIIKSLCSLAVISRPKTTTVAVEEYDATVSAVQDERVKMHMFASFVEKEVSLQVIPVTLEDLKEFQSITDQKKLVVVASSPLIIVDVKENEPESLAFDVPYVTNHHNQENDSNEKKRPSSYRNPDTVSSNGKFTPNLKPPTLQSKLGIPMMSPLLLNSDPNQLLFHLVQLDDDDNVRIKLLENTDSANDVTAVAGTKVVTNDVSRETSDENCTVNFSLYDRYARVIALETKGAILYSDVQSVTKPFVDNVVKHRVKVKMQQDPRDVYSILVTALVEHPHREEKFSLLKTYKNFTNVTQKEILVYEGDVIAIAFRGNVDVPDSEKLIFSFHGCRGVRRHFDIRVANPARQRSLQTYHGAVQIFTLKTPRYSALDKSLAPCAKNGWELSAEFPLLLPKYLKTTPVIINKAPVSLKFKEPLTLDFVRTLCVELSSDWTKFAKALGMGHARIQALKQHHKNQVSDTVVMDVVINWMKTQTISIDKVTPVITALKLCNRWKLATELTHRFSAQRIRRSRTFRDKHFQKVFSLVAQNKTALSKWRQILRNLFSADDRHVDDAIAKIDNKHYNDDYSKCLEALKLWRSSVETPSVWTVVDALRASDCPVVAETLVALEIKRK